LLIAVVWGITIVADSAQFSTAVTELSPPAYVGTALTGQTCVGFAITMVSIWLIPPIVQAIGCRWAFAVLAIGPVFGVAAMARLEEGHDGAVESLLNRGAVEALGIPADRGGRLRRHRAPRDEHEVPRIGDDDVFRSRRQRLVDRLCGARMRRDLAAPRPPELD